VAVRTSRALRQFRHGYIADRSAIHAAVNGVRPARRPFRWAGEAVCKPSAQPTQVRTLHLSPRKTPGQARCALSRRPVLRPMGRFRGVGGTVWCFPGQGLAGQVRGSGTGSAVVEEWLELGRSCSPSGSGREEADLDADGAGQAGEVAGVAGVAGVDGGLVAVDDGIDEVGGAGCRAGSSERGRWPRRQGGCRSLSGPGRSGAGGRRARPGPAPRSSGSARRWAVASSCRTREAVAVMRITGLRIRLAWAGRPGAHRLPL
jgi:hypothetical protein